MMGHVDLPVLKNCLCSSCSDYDHTFGKCYCHGYPDCECGQPCVVFYPPKDDIKDLIEVFKEDG